MISPDRTSAQVLPKNFLRPCLLLLLREHPAHGYDLHERLRPLGFSRDDPGRLYRALRSLENDGLVRSVWEKSSSGPDRRTYELTRAGVDRLHDSAQALSATNEILGEFLTRYAEYPRAGQALARATPGLNRRLWPRPRATSCAPDRCSSMRSLRLILLSALVMATVATPAFASSWHSYSLYNGKAAVEGGSGTHSARLTSIVLPDSFKVRQRATKLTFGRVGSCRSTGVIVPKLVSLDRDELGRRPRPAADRRQDLRLRDARERQLPRREVQQGHHQGASGSARRGSRRPGSSCRRRRPRTPAATPAACASRSATR